MVILRNYTFYVLDIQSLITKNRFFRLIKFTFNNNFKKIFIFLFLIIISSLFESFSIFLLSKMLNFGFREDYGISDNLFSNGTSLFLIFMFSFIITSILKIMVLIFGSRLSSEMGITMGKTLLSNYLNRSPEYILTSKSENVVGLMSTTLDKSVAYIYNMVNFCTGSITSVFIIVTLFYAYGKNFILVVLAILFAYFSYYYFFKSKIFKNKQRITLGIQQRGKVLSIIPNTITDIKAFSIEKKISNQYFLGDINVRESDKSNNILAVISRPFIEGLMITFLALISLRQITEGMEVSQVLISLATLAFGLQRLIPCLQQISASRIELKGSSGAVDLLLDSIKEYKSCQFKSISNFNLTKYISNKKTLCNGLIIENLIASCGFSSKKEISWPLISNIKLGDTIILSGESGSGKSTIYNCLSDFKSLVSGKMYFFDEKGKQRTPICSYISPQSSVIPGSTLDNVRFFRDNIEESKIHEMCKVAEIDKTILKLPLGYKDQIGSKGSRLSSGQAQRIIIARALVNNPDILIIDESINSLDKKVSLKIIKNIKSILPKTIIFITYHGLDKEIKVSIKKNFNSEEYVINNNLVQIVR